MISINKYIYKLIIFHDKIDIQKLEIYKETSKQYRIISKIGFKEIVNKSQLDKVLYYKIYSLDKDKAIEILKEYTKNKIKEYETKIDNCRKLLDLPVNEYTNE